MFAEERVHLLLLIKSVGDVLARRVKQGVVTDVIGVSTGMVLITMSTSSCFCLKRYASFCGRWRNSRIPTASSSRVTSCSV